MFTRAFEEKDPDGIGLEDRLVAAIVTNQMDPKLLVSLLHMYAGRPAQAVDVSHKGKVTLEELLTRQLPPEGDGE